MFLKWFINKETMDSPEAWYKGILTSFVFKVNRETQTFFRKKQEELGIKNSFRAFFSLPCKPTHQKLKQLHLTPLFIFVDRTRYHGLKRLNSIYHKGGECYLLWDDHLKK